MNGNQQRSTVSLLYVEDDEATSAQVTKLLEKNGYRCIVGRNGREGIELFRQHSPEIVLSDILMPDINGLDMAREIRRENPETQFIFTTAFSDARCLLDAIDIGVSQFVVKPIEFNKLLTAIARCIKIINLRGEAERIHYLEAISILAGGMAHDFNNLLQVILGYVSLAKSSSDPGSKAYSYLEMAEKGSTQARELGNTLLTFAEAGQSLMRVDSLLPLITSEVRSTLGDHPIALELDLLPDSPGVRFDETQMRRVFSCLTTNAVEAMPQGGILKISAYSSAVALQDEMTLTPGNYLHIEFSDNGIGIPHENLTKIFDPYFSSKDMGSKKGQGLGLALCSSIIRKHGGAISVDSTWGHGATFHIWLPATATEAATDAAD